MSNSGIVFAPVINDTTKVCLGQELDDVELGLSSYEAVV